MGGERGTGASVAARSCAVRLRDVGQSSGYDICDTTACQVYGGMGRETSNGSAAVRASAGTIVTYRGKVALTQFASSNGGYSARGDYPYLAALRDPYDGVDQVSGVDSRHQRDQHQPGLALGGDSEAVADHQPRRRGRGAAASKRSRSSEHPAPPQSRERHFSTCSACVRRFTWSLVAARR